MFSYIWITTQTGINACQTFARQQEYFMTTYIKPFFLLLSIRRTTLITLLPRYWKVSDVTDFMRNNQVCSHSSDSDACKFVAVRSWHRDAVDIISGRYISRGFIDTFADLPCLALIGIFSRRSRKRSRNHDLQQACFDFARRCDAFANPRFASFPHLNARVLPFAGVKKNLAL